MTHETTRSTRRRGRPSWPALLALLTLSVLGASQAGAAGLLIADGGLGGVLEIEEHAVEITLNNGVAVTEVTQVFRNTENRQVEALYTFPVPKGASVANFSMWIDGTEMIGEVVEKQRAREIYESYKPARRDPGLLEQVDFKRFEMRIFPIGPNAEQRVQITYYQELDFDNDWATYVYPLSTVTDSRVDSRTRGRFALTVDIASEVPIVEIESPSHDEDFVFVEHTANYKRASLEATGGDLDRDVVLAFHTSRPRSGLDLIGSMEPGEDGYFLMTLTAGEELEGDRGGMDYVFILDISGSMNDDGKLAISRNSLGAFIEGLGAEDRFEVITFNVASNPLFSMFRQADDPAKAEAAEFLRGQRARGGTTLEPAIRAAYRYKDADRPLNVVVLSDGMTEQGERSTLLRLIGDRPGSTRVFCIGVGNEVDRTLLRQLAEDADGLAAFISRGDDFGRQAQAFRRKLMRPAVTGIELEIEGGEIYDLEPQRIPNLYHGMPIRIYGRYRKPGPATLRLLGDIGGETFDQTVTVDLPGDEAENPEIERMWAWHRVQRLIKEGQRDDNMPGVVDEIVRLGEGFSIVTEYTSFLVLENDAEYRRWKIERRNALRVERDRKSQQRVRRELETLRRASEAAVGPATDSPKTQTASRRVTAPTTPQAPARPSSSSSSGPAPSNSSRGVDLDFGGGALDPLSVGLVLALGAGSFAASRRRRKDRG